MTMSGQYFKKRREVVEVAVEASVGAGVLAMAQLLNFSVRRCGWRLGLQAVTIIMVSIFFIGQGRRSSSCYIIITSLGMFYRSSSLYHPQRRAILHLKNQTRKIKCKKDENKVNKYENILKSINSLIFMPIPRAERTPLIDISCFKSYTFRLLTLSSAISFTGR